MDSDLNLLEFLQIITTFLSTAYFMYVVLPVAPLYSAIPCRIALYKGATGNKT